MKVLNSVIPDSQASCQCSGSQGPHMQHVEQLGDCRQGSGAQEITVTSIHTQPQILEEVVTALPIAL